MSTRYSLNIARRVPAQASANRIERFEHFARVEFGDIPREQAQSKSRVIEQTFEQADPGSYKFELTYWEELGRPVFFHTEGK